MTSIIPEKPPLDDALLEHHGVKGMKWGVRKDRGHEGERVKAKKLPKLDAKWEKSIYTTRGAVQVHNAMADHFNARIGSVNSKHPDADIRKGEDTPEWKSYMQDVMSLQTQSYSHAVTQVHGTSPSGRKEAVYVDDGKGAPRIVVKDKGAQHSAEDDLPDLVMLLKVGSNGKFIEANKADVKLAHSDDFDAFLEHHGVKGMQWGVRKAANRAVVGNPDKSGVTRRDKRTAYRQSARTRNRALEDFHDQRWKDRDRDIKVARDGLKKANRDYKDEKRAIKSRKEDLGKNATKIALRDAANRNLVINAKANSETTGEKAFRVAVEVGKQVAKDMANKKQEEAARAQARGQTTA